MEGRGEVGPAVPPEITNARGGCAEGFRAQLTWEWQASSSRSNPSGTRNLQRRCGGDSRTPRSACTLAIELQHRPPDLREPVGRRIGPHRQEERVEIRLHHHQPPPRRQVLQGLLQSSVLASYQGERPRRSASPSPGSWIGLNPQGSSLGTRNRRRPAAARRSMALSRCRFTPSPTAGEGGASR